MLKFQRTVLKILHFAKFCQNVHFLILKSISEIGNFRKWSLIKKNNISKVRENCLKIENCKKVSNLDQQWKYEEILENS